MFPKQHTCTLLVCFPPGIYIQVFFVFCVQEFEKRRYVATQWLTTKIEDSTKLALVAANSRLWDYYKRISDAGKSRSKSRGIASATTYFDDFKNSLKQLLCNNFTSTIELPFYLNESICSSSFIIKSNKTK